MSLLEDAQLIELSRKRSYTKKKQPLRNPETGRLIKAINPDLPMRDGDEKVMMAVAMGRIHFKSFLRGANIIYHIYYMGEEDVTNAIKRLEYRGLVEVDWGVEQMMVYAPTKVRVK